MCSCCANLLPGGPQCGGRSEGLEEEQIEWRPSVLETHLGIWNIPAITYRCNVRCPLWFQHRTVTPPLHLMSARFPWCWSAGLFTLSVWTLTDKCLHTPALQDGKNNGGSGNQGLAIRSKNSEVSWLWQLFEDYGVELDPSKKVRFKCRCCNVSGG